MRRVPTLIDTGPIVATLSEQDPYHEECAKVFQELPPVAYTCWPVITEAAYLLGEWTSSTSVLLELLRAEVLEILPLEVEDLDGIEAILTKYADQSLQLADATLMYLAEREGIEQVLTLDRKDFSVFRTSTGRALEIVP